jgi:hypothetical protein
MAYCGEPIFVDELLFRPCHSLIEQSRRAVEAKTGTNADGFGIGWYGERELPGVFRDIMPAWSDENLKAIAHQVRSRLFLAHVRASTGSPTSRVNCHPFSSGRWLFVHNGQIGGFAQMRRRLEMLLPEALYGERQGATDSELVFLRIRLGQPGRHSPPSFGSRPPAASTNRSSSPPVSATARPSMPCASPPTTIARRRSTAAAPPAAVSPCPSRWTPMANAGRACRR